MNQRAGMISTLRFDIRAVWNNAIHVARVPLTWRRKQWLTFISLGVLLVAAFTVDETVRGLMATWHGAVRDSIFDFGHWYGSGVPTLILFLGGYLAGLLFEQSRIRVSGLLIAESYLFSGILTTATKSVIGRWRPFTNHGAWTFTPFVTGPNDVLSFPSGHATVAFALSSILAGSIHSRVAQVLLYLLAIVTAVSRIYHDQHWFSDVCLSAVFGIAVGISLVHHKPSQEGFLA
jgi:membrane-associated phospholipid phosphatase